MVVYAENESLDLEGQRTGQRDVDVYLDVDEGRPRHSVGDYVDVRDSNAERNEIYA